MNTSRKWAAVSGRLVVASAALAAGACSNERANAPAEVAPTTSPVVDMRGVEIPEYGWVWAKGDGEHPSAVLVIGRSGDKLTAQMIMTPPGRERDYARGAVVPMKELECTDRRVTFRLKPVDPSIKPYRNIIEFDAPPDPIAQEITGRMSIDPKDAYMVGLKPEDVKDKSVPLEFRRERWPLAPTFEERTAAAAKTREEALASVDTRWIGTCDEGCTPGSLRTNPRGCTLEVLLVGDRMVSCKVFVPRGLAQGGPKTVFELTDFAGTLRSGAGVVELDKQRHRFSIRAEGLGSERKVVIRDACDSHWGGETPYISATLVRAKE